MQKQMGILLNNMVTNYSTDANNLRTMLTESCFSPSFFPYHLFLKKIG